MFFMFLSLLCLFSTVNARKCNDFLFTSTYVKQWDRQTSCTGLCSSLKVNIGTDWYLGRCDTSPSYCSSHGSQATKVIDRKEFAQLVGKEMLKLLPNDVEIVSTVACCTKDYCNEPRINTKLHRFVYSNQIE